MSLFASASWKVRAHVSSVPETRVTLLPDASCCLEVRAPASGRVLKVLQTSEQVVQTGAALVEIGDPRKLEIVVELLSTDAVKIREGARAEIDGWGGRERLEARVRRIESSGFTKISALGIEEQRVRVVLDLVAEAAPATTLGHDFRVFVRIEQWSSDKALTVPIGALFRRDGKWAVFKVADRRASLGPRRGRQPQWSGRRDNSGSEGRRLGRHASERSRGRRRAHRSARSNPGPMR